MSYLRWFNRKSTPQSEPIPGTDQVLNHAGGYGFAVDDWMRLQRFLILGNEGGTYYQKEQTLTAENARGTLRCITADGPRVVELVRELSLAGRAPRNDPALFVLALCSAMGDEATRSAAFAALRDVARTGTHLYHFAQYVDGLRGWGRGLRKAVGAWFNAQQPRDLAYQVIKYGQRDGWSARDLLRLAHPVAPTPQHQAIYYWITRGWEGVGEQPHDDPALQQIWAMERAKRAAAADEVARLIADYRLPREAVPTQWLQDPMIWRALVAEMPLAALVRNLATLTRLGVLGPLEPLTQQVCARIADGEGLRKARLHPIAVLAALKTYAQGRGERGQHHWTPLPEVVEALDVAFYRSFGNVESTGKRWLLALDVSGSMGMGTVSGVPGLTPRVASGAFALVLAATEPRHHIVAFEQQLTPLAISPRQRLDDVLRQISDLPFGGTDCSLPMLYALEQRIAVDVFVIITDNETWAGEIHPAQALQRYRRKMHIPAKLVVVGMTATDISIADPDDASMLDVVGFDAAAPALIADFARQ